MPTTGMSTRAEVPKAEVFIGFFRQAGGRLASIGVPEQSFSVMRKQAVFLTVTRSVVLLDADSPFTDPNFGQTQFLPGRERIELKSVQLQSFRLGHDVTVQNLLARSHVPPRQPGGCE
jgi:hypothetical protein